MQVDLFFIVFYVFGFSEVRYALFLYVVVFLAGFKGGFSFFYMKVVYFYIRLGDFVFFGNIEPSFHGFFKIFVDQDYKKAYHSYELEHT